MRELDEYAEAVLDVVDAIPPGRVMSYGQVAALVGRRLDRGGPRQVARVLREYGASATWWRVLRADGSFAPEVAARQGELLVAEGVPVRGDRVARSLFVGR
ncbi:MGMT family protein [Cumulibacter manganitolerans]|uniref:MGMT family protein n=1 Tax=Cumulibacter manganitolerans TaxID=1884992 RepID=UPI0012982055|nr:MGMT family protein [Cumulibacter manganitolerans]